MRNIIFAGSLAGLLALTSCAGTTPAVIETDASTALTDALALLNVLETSGKIGLNDAAVATQVISGLQALLGVMTTNASEGTEAQVLAATSASVAQIKADMPTNAVVQKAAAAAETALAALTATESADAKTQAETALGVLALDYLAAQQGTVSEARPAQQHASLVVPDGSELQAACPDGSVALDNHGRRLVAAPGSLKVTCGGHVVLSEARR